MIQDLYGGVIKMIYEDFVSEASIDADFTDDQIEEMLEADMIDTWEAGFLHGRIAA